MSNKPLVSAIIIFWNEERFIEEAIESVFSQTYDHWELLLVDDGSTDRSSYIAQRYSEQHPGKVRYLEHRDHEKRGMSASRNLGVRSARGKYISFLDGDDIWLPNKLEEQVGIIEAEPEAAMVYGPLRMWFSWTGEPHDFERDHLYGVRPDGTYPFSNTLVEAPRLLCLFLRHEEYIPSGFLADREIMQRVATYEDVFRDAYSDAVALVKLCLTAKVFVSSQCWYLYRKHEASNSYISWLEGKDKAEQLFFLNWIERYLSERGVKESDVWQALRQTLYPHRHPKLHQIRKRALHCARRLSPTLYSWVEARRSGRKYLPSEEHPTI